MKTFFIVGGHHRVRNCIPRVAALERLRAPVLRTEEAIPFSPSQDPVPLGPYGSPVWPLILWILSVSWWVMGLCLNQCATQERQWDNGIRPTLWRQLNARVKERWFPRSKMDSAAEKAGEWTLANNDNKGQQSCGLCEHTNSTFGTWVVSASIVWGHSFQFINKLFLTPVVSHITHP